MLETNARRQLGPRPDLHHILHPQSLGLRPAFAGTGHGAGTGSNPIGKREFRVLQPERIFVETEGNNVRPVRTLRPPDPLGIERVPAGAIEPRAGAGSARKCTGQGRCRRPLLALLILESRNRQAVIERTAGMRRE